MLKTGILKWRAVILLAGRLGTKGTFVGRLALESQLFLEDIQQLFGPCGGAGGHLPADDQLGHPSGTYFGVDLIYFNIHGNLAIHPRVCKCLLKGSLAQYLDGLAAHCLQWFFFV